MTPLTRTSFLRYFMATSDLAFIPSARTRYQKICSAGFHCSSLSRSALRGRSEHLSDFLCQEPLYLPSGSELQVSIWRLTTEKQVWYEWHAESFLSVPRTSSSNEDLLLPPNGVHSPSFPGGAPPSPMADREDPFLLDSQPRRSATFPTSAAPKASTKELEFELVKIGHTSLHNPGGRSSWIGL